ncbi:alpha-L-fucosidase [Fontisphaera persica]|uniref:alpha-L-fucosidase n=1 Tax=Fontisphaera persica TaxID=2974023 RepID=UPI0024C02F5A|nr:alpha-L-fucosidase [Fontisphaera persica]WCJ59405.1 alpha-L-fucosidase [Fontisphaera persica]
MNTSQLASWLRSLVPTAAVATLRRPWGHAFPLVLACGVGWYLMSMAAALPAATNLPPIARGPYTADMESLKQYQYPKWFQDAKFGIWSHWGPQSVPMAGDWYARHLYTQGHRQYQHHLEHYGHPSTNGWKDIIPLWKAEKFDPERLMALYKRAGARYFVSMGVHHDNFDLWNSRFQRWNAVNMGPQRDIVGAWQKAAKKYGLYFGVSEHLGASFTWWQGNKGSDKTGPLAGVPYDGANPAYEDLYHFRAEPGDTGWYSKNPRWQQMWFNRIKDLVDQYHPDLLYTDGGVPFGNEVGLSLIAHYYNSDRRRSGTRPQVVYTCKQRSEGRWVEDLERGVMAGINPQPWQTDTSIGDWFYNKDWKFRPIDWVVHMLVDITSKNGNLLLNVVQRPDGTLDPEVEQMLEQLGDWMAINGEAIYGTRPWITYGEGRVRASGGHFKEDFQYTAADIRFTTKGETLYAFLMGWPSSREVLIRSLAARAGSGVVTGVSLLGHKGKLAFRQDAQGLQVTLPEKAPCAYAVALKITGKRMRDFTPAPPLLPVAEPNAQGHFKLPAGDAEIRGSRLKTEQRGGRENLGFWDDAREYAVWRLRVPAAGTYEVTALCATVHQGSELRVEGGQPVLEAVIPASGSWDVFQPVKLGRLTFAEGGEKQLVVRPKKAETWKAINVAEIQLTKVP